VHPWWTPVRVILALTALCFALGMVQKAPCYDAQWTNSQSRYSEMCYSDLPYLYVGRGFAELDWPYSDAISVRDRYDVMEYPVGISYYAYAAAYVTHWLSGSPDLTTRGGMSQGQLSADHAVLRESLLFTAVNAVGFGICALVAAWLLTGALIGLGTALKLYPLFLLGGLIVIRARQRRWADLARSTVVGVVVWVVVNAPAYLSGHHEWSVFWTSNARRGADLGSPWLIAQQMFHTTYAPHTINLWSWVAFGAWCVVVAAIGMRAPKTPRLAQLGVLVVIGFLLVNKVYSPQYALWLLPLAVMARPRWRDLLIWQAGEIFYFASVWWYLGGYLNPGGGGDPGFYWLAVGIRIAAQVYLAVIVIRDLLLPEYDVVRVGRPQDLRRSFWPPAEPGRLTLGRSFERRAPGG
jgi:uncharacterized membrane protein